MTSPPTARAIALSQSARDYLDLEAAFLRRAGFEVIVAADGPDMLAMIDRDAPELCILDVAMPGIAGDEIVKRVRSAQGDHGPAFILVTTGGSENLERCLRSGADEVFTEPFRKEDLLRKAAALLRIPRRVHARVLIRFEVEGQAGSRIPFFGSSVNLSRGGILLETLEALEVGSELHLSFFLPGHPARITCRGSIVRGETAEGGFHRYGVRFQELGAPGVRAIEDFVKRREVA